MLNPNILKIIFLICFFIKSLLTQTIDLKFGEERNEKVKKYGYYQINLLEKGVDYNDYLVINVAPTDNYENFSDPDIYVSKVIYV